MRPAIGGEKAVLSPQSSIFNPQSSLLSPQSTVLSVRSANQKTIHFSCRNAKKNVFAPKNLIYRILVANVARISTYALWGQNSGSSQLVRIPRGLCRPGYNSFFSPHSFEKTHGRQSLTLSHIALPVNDGGFGGG